MSNIISIPKLLGVNFYEIDYVRVPQYMSYDPDDYPFKQSIRGYETQTNYIQKWQINDSVPFQFIANFGSIQLDVIDCNQTVLYSAAMAQRKADKYNPGYYAYEGTLSFNIFSPGRVWLRLILGGTTQMISEPIDLAVIHKDTLLFEYWNTTYFGSLLFETGIQLKFRVECIKKNATQNADRKVYNDQNFNPTVLKARPYRSWDFVFGKDYGIPDWVAEKLNWIFSCDNVLADGKSYAVAEDGKLEAAEVDPVYPMRMNILKVQEGINRSSKFVGVAVDLSQRIIMSTMVDQTLFGDLAQPGSNLIQITDFE